jgi:hypothetical protein
MSNHVIVLGRSEPAKVLAFDTKPLFAMLLAGNAYGMWGFFVKRYNALWLAAAFAPFLAATCVAWCRQPTDQIQNYYRYLLAKRAATCEHEKNAQRMADLDFGKLKSVMESQNKTLYDIEQSLVERISNGSF